MNVIVLFPPGLAGNHLANMIATDPRYHSRASVEQYEKSKRYAHHSGNKNLTEVNVTSRDWNVLCGHFGELKWFDTKPFGQLQTVIVEVPVDKNSNAYLRWQTYNKHITDYHVEEQRLLYTPELVNTVHGIDDHYTINAQEIITEEPPIKQIQSMEFDIDVEVCKQMHRLWINSNLNLLYKTVAH